MAGPYLHEKLHRANHHTLSSVGLPDSATDPIASPNSPFRGNFYLSGFWNTFNNISANGSSVFDHIEITDVNSNPSLYIETTNKPSITTNSPISSNKVIYDYLYNSDVWNSTYNHHSIKKYVWYDLYNYTSSTSANYNKLYLYTLNLSTNSINWSNTYNLLTAKNDYWNNTFSYISSVSANWNNEFANYTKWNSVVVPLVVTKINHWDSSYNTLINSNWTSTYNTTNLLSSRWKSNYQTLNSNQSAWDSNNQTVTDKIDSWDSLYNTLNTISGIDTPIGCVIAFPKNSIPDGWLKCNGASYSRTVYSKLFEKIGTAFTVTGATTSFNVPDLRGIFIRGWVDNRPETTEKNVGFGAKFGEIQQDQIQGHWHLFTKYTDRNGGLPEGNDMYGTAGDGSGGFITSTTSLAYTKNAYSTDPNIVSYYGSPRVGFETRPINMSLLYCIKYK